MLPDDVYRAIGVILVALVALFGAFALIQFISVSPLWSEQGAAWIQAIGSVAAIWIAVLFWMRDTKLKEDESLAIGLIAAVEISFTALRQAEDIGKLINFLRKAEELAFPHEVLDQAITTLEDMKNWSVIEISQLAGLGSECALNLARSQHMRSIALHHLRDIRADGRDHGDIARFRELSAISDILGRAKWNLDDVAARMLNSSAPAARAGIDS